MCGFLMAEGELRFCEQWPELPVDVREDGIGHGVGRAPQERGSRIIRQELIEDRDLPARLQHPRRLADAGRGVGNHGEHEVQQDAIERARWKALGFRVRDGYSHLVPKLSPTLVGAAQHGRRNVDGRDLHRTRQEVQIESSTCPDDEDSLVSLKVQLRDGPPPRSVKWTHEQIVERRVGGVADLIPAGGVERHVTRAPVAAQPGSRQATYF